MRSKRRRGTAAPPKESAMAKSIFSNNEAVALRQPQVDGESAGGAGIHRALERLERLSRRGAQALERVKRARLNRVKTAQ